MAKEKTKKKDNKIIPAETKKSGKSLVAKKIKKKRGPSEYQIIKKRLRGRPTKYEPKFAVQMVAFFNRDYWTEEEIVKMSVMGPVPVKIKRPTDFPTFEKFAADIMVDQDTLINWANAKDDDGKLINPDFFGAYKICKAKQKDFLIYHGLNGSYNGSFAIFAAKNVTDMRDKSEVEHGGNLSLGIASISKVIQEQQAKVIEVKEADFADFEAITPANTGEYSKSDN